MATVRVRTLLSQNAQELQAVQLELEGFIGLSGRRQVGPLLLHPLQRWLQVAIVDLCPQERVQSCDSACGHLKAHTAILALSVVVAEKGHAVQP